MRTKHPFNRLINLVFLFSGLTLFANAQAQIARDTINVISTGPLEDSINWLQSEWPTLYLMSYFDNGNKKNEELRDTNWFIYSYEFNEQGDTLMAIELTDPSHLIYHIRYWHNNGVLEEDSYEQLCKGRGMIGYGTCRYYDKKGRLIRKEVYPKIGGR